jgi:hypothetical protein
MQTISKFLQIFSLNPNFLLAHRNRYLEGTDDGQKTPRGHPNFNSYVKNLRVLVFITDRQTDGRTETLISVGFSHYIPPGKKYLGVGIFRRAPAEFCWRRSFAGATQN